MTIQHISETALWVAMYRALETERSDALFRDPWARRMAGSVGERIMRSMPFGEAMGWAMVVRTAVIDELVQRCIGRGARCVVNLGAGLDTRAFRLDLPGDLHWIDVDLPEMVAYREENLLGATPACQHRHIAADLNKPGPLHDVLGEAHEQGGPILVLSEGLLVYLEPAQVAHLAIGLHAEAHARWWITDIISPLLLATVGASWQPRLARAGAALRFAPADSADFFGKLGWRQAEFHPVWDAAGRLGRPAPMAWWWNSFGAVALPGGHASLRRMAGLTLLEHVQRPPSGTTSVVR
ncbi:MAG: SAM-dependent methyltransferase [Burkholderiales bacterium]|nr:SAM-dependent methyltransferase [Burkholderiales bacterium]